MTNADNTTRSIRKEEVKALQTAISTAAWNLDLWSFAERLGNDADHDYTKGKFKEFTELSRALGRFDAETLTKVIEGF